MNNNNKPLNNFEALQISLASTEKIISWSRGEVKKAETINYRTLKPERDGLFCERIFGPVKDWVCNCGKYKNYYNKGIICDRCGVEVTRAKVRRERMGHIALVSPVSHIWYFKGIPSRIGLILDMTPKNLEKVLYFAAYVVIDPGETNLAKMEIISEDRYREYRENYKDGFRVGMGAEAIRELLQGVDLDTLVAELRGELIDASGQRRTKIVRRLDVLESLRQSGNKPEWMILEAIPVIPPDIRPMVQLDGGRFATSDLNDLYRRVINRNNRLKDLFDKNAPEIIVRNERRMLQEAVDSLIDNGRRGRPVTGPGSRPLKSLSDMLKGKQGRFRQNLLGKRVDYSGRSVIVVGPELKFYQCGLPKTMATELFLPFIEKELVDKGYVLNPKEAKNKVKTLDPMVWEVIDDVIKDHPILLNRAPTLHRLGIQAFEPVLVEGKAIKLHPLVCTAYNADFDGDQMAVHVPLTLEAQAEARFLMLSVNNILAPKDGSPITTPTQDMILGSYYLTLKREGIEDDDKKVKIFTDYDEMLHAYNNNLIKIHEVVRVRRFAGESDKHGKLIKSTVGRFIFNENIPQDLGFVPDRTADPYSLEVDFLCDKKALGRIIDRCFRRHANTKTAMMLDHIKTLGFHYSTIGAVTVSISDMEIPKAKEKIVKKADEKVAEYEKAYRSGLMSENERYEGVVRTWTKATDDVADALMESLGPLNNLFIMANSGARGSKNQIRQVGGMRGLMANATGKTIEIPIKANFREGLSVLEYFISTNGARKGLADTALRTAESGYLTRRLVDVSHNVIIRDEDCGSEEFIMVEAFVSGKELIEPLRQRIIGRIAGKNIADPITGELIVARNDEITESVADRIEEAEITSVPIRTAMTCNSKTGICAKCYGRNLATGEIVNIGEAVGIIAAQSIGEPGTQLTMRTFHTGGVAGGDITQGLPRVEELFEARKPKALAEITTMSGTVKSIEMREDNKTDVTIEGEAGIESYSIPYGRKIIVKEGDAIEAGDPLTVGPLYPKDILLYKGVEGVYHYLVSEVQRVYKLQGVDINDKHIEIIVSRMLSKYKVEEAGDTNLLPGGLYTKFDLEAAFASLAADSKFPEISRELQGITKASLSTSSFLSAASFQETTKVLTDAAIKGKTDRLVGLKENVIIGKLIPAGTGMKLYKNVDIDYGENEDYIKNYIPDEELFDLDESDAELDAETEADLTDKTDGAEPIMELDSEPSDIIIVEDGTEDGVFMENEAVLKTEAVEE